MSKALDATIIYTVKKKQFGRKQKEVQKDIVVQDIVIYIMPKK